MGTEQSSQIGQNSLQNLEKGQNLSTLRKQSQNTRSGNTPIKNDLNKESQAFQRLHGDPRSQYTIPLYLIDALESSTTEAHNLAQHPSKKTQKKNSGTPQSKNQHKIKVSFIWKYGGYSVQLIGSFGNWTQKHQMRKEGNKFVAVLELEKGFHQYKFYVDGQWKYAPDQNHIRDQQGNINNILNTEEYAPQFQESKIIKDWTDDGTSRGIGEGGGGRIDLRRQYGIRIPKPDDFGPQASTIQPQQLRNFLTGVPPASKFYKNLNHSPELPRIANSNSSLPVPSHNLINHISYSRRKDIGGGKVISMTGMTHRVRHKYVTTVFYKYQNQDQ